MDNALRKFFKKKSFKEFQFLLWFSKNQSLITTGKANHSKQHCFDIQQERALNSTSPQERHQHAQLSMLQNYNVKDSKPII